MQCQGRVRGEEARQLNQGLPYQDDWEPARGQQSGLAPELSSQLQTIGVVWADPGRRRGQDWLAPSDAAKRKPPRRNRCRCSNAVAGWMVEGRCQKQREWRTQPRTKSRAAECAYYHANDAAADCR